MKSITTFGANYSGRAYKGTLPAASVLFVGHEFRATSDGQLEHFMDGRLCATVPPEGFAEYALTWPACKPVLNDLRGAERSASATIKPGKKKKR